MLTGHPDPWVIQVTSTAPFQQCSGTTVTLAVSKLTSLSNHEHPVWRRKVPGGEVKIQWRRGLVLAGIHLAVCGPLIVWEEAGRWDWVRSQEKLPHYELSPPPPAPAPPGPDVVT